VLRSKPNFYASIFNHFTNNDHSVESIMNAVYGIVSDVSDVEDACVESYSNAGESIESVRAFEYLDCYELFAAFRC
jgi:hypothetical protein